MQNKESFLMLVPMIANKQQWLVNEEGLVEIIIPRVGLMDRMIRVFIRTPKAMKIRLDAKGSCVWKTIDGIKNIHEISRILEEKFTDAIDPSCKRLATFMKILVNNRFIYFNESYANDESPINNKI